MDDVAGWNRLLANTIPVVENGFYVHDGKLNIYNTGLKRRVAENDNYAHVVLTNSGGTAATYLNGALQVRSSTTIMDIDGSDTLTFFVDNGNLEYSNGRAALVRLYSGALSGEEVGKLAADPFAGLGGGSGVPEPGTWTLMLAGAAVLGGTRALRRKRQAI